MRLNVLAVLDNGLVRLHALVGGEVLVSGLVRLRALVGEEIYQLADGSDHALHHGRRPCGDAWRVFRLGDDELPQRRRTFWNEE